MVNNVFCTKLLQQFLWKSLVFIESKYKEAYHVILCYSTINTFESCYFFWKLGDTCGGSKCYVCSISDILS